MNNEQCFERHCGLDPQSHKTNEMLKQVQHDAKEQIFKF
jgi:hypothetical protein